MAAGRLMDGAMELWAGPSVVVETLEGPRAMLGFGPVLDPVQFQETEKCQKC